METLFRKVAEVFLLNYPSADTTFSFSDAKTLNNGHIDVSCATHNTVKVLHCFKLLMYFMLRQSE